MAVALATLPVKRWLAWAGDDFEEIAAGAGFSTGLAGVVFAGAALLAVPAGVAGLETGLAGATVFFAGGFGNALPALATGFVAGDFLAGAAGEAAVFTAVFFDEALGAADFLERMTFFGCCLTTACFAAGFFAAAGLATAFFATVFLAGCFAAGAFFAGILLALFTAVPFF